MTPQRIQLSRAAGWRKPVGAIVVSRPSKWGNPFGVAEWGLDLSLALYEDIVRGFWNPTHLADRDDATFALAMSLAGLWRKRIGGHPIEIARSELAGHDLCCWCGAGQRCHADLLIRVANPEGVGN
jgi:hypothetical protein